MIISIHLCLIFNIRLKEFFVKKILALNCPEPNKIDVIVEIFRLLFIETSRSFMVQKTENITRY